MKKNWINIKNVGWVIVFVCIFLFWIVQANRKEDMHCDEYFSYMGANSNFEEEGVAFDDLGNGEWITPDYLMEKYSVNQNEFFMYRAVWNNQKLDVHPPLYYIVLHLVSSFFPGRFSMIPGLLLNIVCMMFLLIVIYKTLYLLSDNSIMSLAATAAYGACTGVLSTIVFIRMYALAALFVGITVYLYAAEIYGKIKNTTFLIAIFVTNLLGGLTHYYFLVFAVITFMVYFSWKLKLILSKRQEKREMIAYILANAASGVVYLLIWPNCVDHILYGYRGEEAFENVAQVDNLLGNIGAMFAHLDQGLWVNSGKWILLLTCIIVIGLYLKEYWDQSIGFAFGLGIVAIIYFLMIAQVSSFKSDRYLMPIYPLIAIAIYICLITFFKFFGRGTRVFLILMGVFVFANALHTPNYLYEFQLEKVSKVIDLESENGLYVYQGNVWFQLAANTLYLEEIKNTKMVFDMGDSELIREDERLQDLSSICVFFDSNYTEENMIEYFDNNLWNGNYEYSYLDSGSACNIYLFKRTDIIQEENQ